MTIKDIDLQRVLHIYTVETLYAAIVDGYVEWRSALIEAVVRAELSGAATMHPAGLCFRRLANLLQLANSYREGREWSCECHYCRLLAGVRNYLPHHWGRGHAAFAIWAGPAPAAATATRQDNGADGSDPRTYAPHVDIELVSKRLKERRKFDRAARVLGKGARRFNFAPAVEGCLRCLSASPPFRPPPPEAAPMARRRRFRSPLTSVTTPATGVRTGVAKGAGARFCSVA